MLMVLALSAALTYVAATTAHALSLFGAGTHNRSEGRALALTLTAAVLHASVVAWLVAGNGAGVVLTIGGGVITAGLALVSAYLGLAWRLGWINIGALVSPLAALSATPALFADGPQLISGVLGNVLLVVHVSSALLGTVAFVLAFVVALLYVIQQRQLKRKRLAPWLRRLPSLERLDTMGLRIAAAGFAIYTLSIVLGSFWAWQHLSLRLEARSLLAALTWFIYALMIQGRLTAGWRGRKAALLTISGTVCALGVIVVYLSRAGMA